MDTDSAGQGCLNSCNLGYASAVYILRRRVSGRGAIRRLNGNRIPLGSRATDGGGRVSRSLQQACNMPATCLQPRMHAGVALELLRCCTHFAALANPRSLVSGCSAMLVRSCPPVQSHTSRPARSDQGALSLYLFFSTDLTPDWTPEPGSSVMAERQTRDDNYAEFTRTPEKGILTAEGVHID
jgi:hypothetical protein